MCQYHQIKDDPEFTFQGRLYVRPCGRGLSIVDSEDGEYLEDLLEENEQYDILLFAKKVK